MSNLLEVKNLKQYFPIRKGFWRTVAGHVHAVDNVSLEVRAGETLGLVGESGCGKTTVGRTILRLLNRDRGRLHLDNRDVTLASGIQLRNLHPRQMQIVFQDPYSSLNRA